MLWSGGEFSAKWTIHDEECVVVATEKRARYFESLSVGAPCFSEEEMDFSPAETRLLLTKGFSPGSARPGAKARL